MKRKNILLGIVSLLTLTIVLPAEAKPDMYLEMQCEITEMIWTSPYTFEAYIEGVASGPDIRTGHVTGVDYGYFDENGLHLNVYYTVTDKDGDSISVHVTGDSIITNPGRIVFKDATAKVIDEIYNSVYYPTNGKYGDLEGYVFRDEGFVTAADHSGHVHAKWFWDDSLN